MKNVSMVVKENVLIITVDLTKGFGRSASGKTFIIASTEGNQPVDHSSGAIVGLNVYKR